MRCVDRPLRANALRRPSAKPEQPAHRRPEAVGTQPQQSELRHVLVAVVRVRSSDRALTTSALQLITPNTTRT